MPSYRRLVAILWQIMALLAAAPALGQSNLPRPAPATHIAAELIAEKPAAPGATILLALHFRPAPGWHGYWLNPGDAGFGMGLDWVPAAGVGAPLYPVPETLLVSGLMNHVYQRDYAVLVPWTAPKSAAPGSTVPITVKANWLACTEAICVPERAELATKVTIGAGAADPRFDGWRAALPAPLGAQAHYAATPGHLRLAIPMPASVALDRPHLFPEIDQLIDYAAPQAFSRQGDLLIVTLARKPGPLPVTQGFAAVLRLSGEAGVRFAATAGIVPPDGTPIAADGPAPVLPALPWLLLAALAGGLILNIMPCVFPILSLKALSLARAGGDARGARAEGFAYTAGVVLACLILGGALLALRAGGTQVGWAFQLQEPGVVAALLLLATGITANLAGLFELSVPGFVQTGAPGARHGAAGAFLTGLLAAFVATPCTGPFMAGAMGAALLLPVGPALALFAALGLGIALPFLALALVPPLRRLMPRPGRWMEWFRRAMALPMALTALALAWLASRLGGTSFAVACFGLALLLLAALTLIGRRQRRGLGIAGWTAATVLVLAALAVAILPRSLGRAEAETPDLLASQPFSEAALAQARAAGHPVFVYMTADWCLSCKVNERLAIETAATHDAFARAGVVVLKGDWTRRDPAITRYLTGVGAAGVPLYMWYPKGGAPRQLPQVLTSGTLAALP